MERIFRKTELHKILDGMNCHTIDEVILIVVTFVDRSRENDRKTPIKRIHMRYSEIISDGTGDLGQHARKEKELRSLEQKLEKVRIILEEILDEQ